MSVLFCKPIVIDILLSGRPSLAPGKTYSEELNNVPRESWANTRDSKPLEKVPDKVHRQQVHGERGR